MIFSWVTSFTKNFVISGLKITQIFRSGCDCTSTSSARSPQADVTISVYGEVSIDTVLTPSPVPLLLAAPLVIHVKGWESIDVVELSYPPDSLWNPVAIPAHLATVHFVILRRFPFYLCLRFLLIHTTGFTVTPHSPCHFILLLDFPCWS